MLEKKCTLCQEIKSESDFHKSNSNKSKLQSRCKTCAISVAKKHYENTQQATMDRAYVYKQKFMATISYIKGKYGCQNCGCNDEICLDYHHIDPSNKLSEVARIAQTKNIEAIVLEINKCAVVCANCHRRIHKNQINVDKFKTCNETVESFQKILTDLYGKKKIYRPRFQPQNREVKFKLCKCGDVKNTKSQQCNKCYKLSLRKTERPSKEELDQLLLTNSYCAVARMYNVSDNTIRKWEKSYSGEVLMFYI